MKGLFIPPNPEASKLYRQIWKENYGDSKTIRMLIHPMWKGYEDLADYKFVKEFQVHFDGCFWEMYLSMIMRDSGLSISSKDAGPDIKIDRNGEIEWVEAISPINGPNVPVEFSEDFLISRITGAITEKYRQYKKYLEKGIIHEDEAYIIAVNISEIGTAATRTDRLLLKSLFPIDGEVAIIDKATGLGKTSFDFRDKVFKDNGSPIATNNFLDEKFAGISGVIFSRKDCINLPVSHGSEISFFHNPKARVSVEESYLPFGSEYKGYFEGDILVYSKLK